MSQYPEIMSLTCFLSWGLASSLLQAQLKWAWVESYEFIINLFSRNIRDRYTFVSRSSNTGQNSRFHGRVLAQATCQHWNQVQQDLLFLQCRLMYISCRSQAEYWDSEGFDKPALLDQYAHHLCWTWYRCGAYAGDYRRTTEPRIPV